MENGVPMTCCIITNIHDPMAYMRPLPLNQTKCQISEAQKNVGFRHQEVGFVIFLFSVMLFAYLSIYYQCIGAFIYPSLVSVYPK